MDNAQMEDLVHALKTELVYHRTYRTHNEAKRDPFVSVEGFYLRGFAVTEAHARKQCWSLLGLAGGQRTWAAYSTASAWHLGAESARAWPNGSAHP